MSSTLTVLLYYSGVLGLVILGSMLIYNVYGAISWRLAKQKSPTNTPYEDKLIKKHEKMVLITLPMIIAIAFGIYLYSLPVSSKELIGTNIPPRLMVEKVYITRYGSSESINYETEDKQKIESILAILNNYKYKRNIYQTRLGNVTGTLYGSEFMTLTMWMPGVNKSVVFDITNEGSIYNAHSGYAYRVETDNAQEFFDRLSSIVEIKK